MKILMLLAFPLAACAAPTATVAASDGGARTSAPAPQRVFTGWITFQREFALYERREDVGNTFDRTCYSGQMTRFEDHRKAAKKFDGRAVRVVGSLVSAKEYGGETGLGAFVENYCARDHVLIATAITLDPARPPAPAP